jgi:hypothetical protein
LSGDSQRSVWATVAAVTAVAVIVVVVLAAIAANWAKVTGESWRVDYGGHASSYLEITSWSPRGAVSGWTHSSFPATLTIASTDYLEPHNVTSLAVTSPLAISSVSPSLPIVISPGGTVTFTLKITMPSAAGSYQLLGTITTT